MAGTRVHSPWVVPTQSEGAGPGGSDPCWLAVPLCWCPVSVLAVTTASTCVSWPLDSVFISLATSYPHRHCLQGHGQCPASNRHHHVSPAWRGAACYLGNSCAASEATFRVSEKLGREPESPAAGSCSFSSFPISAWNKFSGDKFGLGGISHPWKVTLPLPSCSLSAQSRPLWMGLPAPKQWDVLRAGPIHLPEGWAIPVRGWGGLECGEPPCSPAPELQAEEAERGVRGAATLQGPQS